MYLLRLLDYRHQSGLALKVAVTLFTYGRNCYAYGNKLFVL
jgi:hypothetical protein